MNDPDLRKIVNQIAELMSSGIVCKLNPDTGEVRESLKESFPFEDYAIGYEEEERKYEEEIDNWERVWTFKPLNSHNGYRMMEDFLRCHEQEIGPDFERLSAALDGKRPFAKFKAIVYQNDKLKECWHEFKDDYLRWYVIEEMKEKMGEIEFTTYPLDEDAISIMALGVFSGRYVYCSPGAKTVLVSSIITQPGTSLIHDDGEEEIITHYTIEEELLRLAEQHYIFKSGGGITIEPVNIDPDRQNERTLEQVEREIRQSVSFFFKAEKHLRNFLDAKSKESQN